MKGRREIYTDLIPTGDIKVDSQIIPVILKNALTVHEQNVAEIRLLQDYYYNETAIESKTKTQQSEINNKIAIPYANIAVTTINSYCFSTPFTRNSRSSDESVTEKIKLFNDALDDDDYDSKTSQAEWNAGICALGYKYVRPATKEEKARNIWFKTVADLNPLNTFVVKSNSIDKEPVLACTYFTRQKYDANNREFKKEVVYNVYTKYHYWKFIRGDGNEEYRIETQTVDGKQYTGYPLTYQRIPIIEYIRKQDRTGDFEIAISLIDGINNLTSSRVDDVQQAVDYLLILRDIACETDEDLQKIRKAVKDGILAFRSVQGATVQPEVKTLETRINQSEVQTLQDYLCHKVEEALNIPNRETRGSSGDTGLAVESRAGYRALENIAGLVTLSAKKAENETLDTILAICKTEEGCPFADLTVNDIEIKANRNKVENITTASNAYSTMKNAGMNDLDSLIASNIVPDPIGTAQRNKLAQQEAQQLEEKASTTTNDINTETENQ